MRSSVSQYHEQTKKICYVSPYNWICKTTMSLERLAISKLYSQQLFPHLSPTRETECHLLRLLITATGLSVAIMQQTILQPVSTKVHRIANTSHVGYATPSEPKSTLSLFQFHENHGLLLPSQKQYRYVPLINCLLLLPFSSTTIL